WEASRTTSCSTRLCRFSLFLRRRDATDEHLREKTGRLPPRAAADRDPHRGSGGGSAAVDADPPPEDAGHASPGARPAYRRTADATGERGVRENAPAVPHANRRVRGR